MSRIVRKRVTTTVTDEVEMILAPVGSKEDCRVLTVGAYGTYKGNHGDCHKPQINLNAKWVAEAGFSPGDTIQLTIHENRILIEKLVIA